jgi:hypothetical protein
MTGANHRLIIEFVVMFFEGIKEVLDSFFDAGSNWKEVINFDQS